MDISKPELARLLRLLVKWGEPATWAAAYGEVADMRKFRREAAAIREVGLKSPHARHLDHCAEEARLRAIARVGELIEIENGLREHSPELLELVPVVDIFGPPEDLKSLAFTMRKIEGQLRVILASPPDAGTTEDGVTIRRMAAAMDSVGAQVAHIAGDRTRSVDERLRLVAALDDRYYGKTPKEWGILLDVTRQAIEKTHWWLVTRVEWLGRDR